MKKFLGFLIAICTTVACAFGAACTKDPVSDWEKKWQINQTDWLAGVNTDTFTVHNQDFQNRLGYFVLVYNDGVYNLDILNSEDSGIYAKKGADEYVRAESFGGVWTETESTKEEFDGNIQGYLSLLDFIKNNRSKFTQDGMMYAYTLTGEEQELTALKETLGLQEIRFGWVGLMDGSGRLEIQAYLNCGDAGLNIYFNAQKYGYLLKYMYDKAAEGFVNFTLTGGPSETDVDYCELKVTSEGMHAYYPNRGTTQADKERIAKINGDGTYTTYTPDNAGGWTSATISEYNYLELVKQIVTVYLGEIEQKIASFECKGTKLVNEEGYTWENGKYTYSYYDFEITLNGGKLSSMTWKMKVKDNSINAESLEYSLSLVAGNTTIDYPNA